MASYANFCRVTGSPEELIVDFGLNPQPIGVPKDPIEVKQRIIVNFYTAKRLLAALQMSVARHEAVFGVLETDINKRVRPGLKPNQSSKKTDFRELRILPGALFECVFNDVFANKR